MKILLADDDPLCVEYMQGMLADWGFDVVRAADAAQALVLLQEPDGPSIAIIDALLAGEEGVALCRAIRDDSAGRYVYLLVLTAQADAAFVAAALEAGADDTIGKPFTPEKLRVRVRAGARIAELEAQLRFRESRDPLTGIYNRATMFEMLQTELARQARSHHAVSVMLCDVDNFKGINERFSHQGGDEVLREVVRRMGASVRPYDAFGRYSGQELLAVLPNCEVEGALEVAERMRAAVAGSAIETSHGPVAVSVSIGVATLDVGELPKLADLMQRVDYALHRAKQNGGDSITIAG